MVKAPEPQNAIDLVKFAPICGAIIFWLLYQWECFSRRRRLANFKGMEKERVIAAFKKISAKKMRGFKPSYDRAAWHYEPVAELGLSKSAAYLPGGLLLGWAIERGLTSAEFNERVAPEGRERFCRGEISGTELYQLIGGRLFERLFIDGCCRFFDSYVHREKYWDDLNGITPDGKSPYKLPDSEGTFECVKEILDLRYSEFISNSNESGS